ncbi:MAG TPA: hypothetical protein VK671_05820 [Mucilaginibacter sp.]|jgi:hypothetical protein|nr:hypothetical protein [Mucilaginibacter sp.]
MKNLVAAILCFLTLCASSQDKTDKKEINVYGRDGKTVIARVLVDATVKNNLFLIKTIQKKDSANNYITKFYLGNKGTDPVLNMRLLLRFSKPVTSVMPSFSTAFNNMNGLSEDRNTYVFKAGRLERDAGSVIVISFTIKSKDRIVTEISGLDGVLQ